MNSQNKISVLIVDGMNNHDWKRITTHITTILNHSGLFTVEVSTAPDDSGSESDWAAWQPSFADYDVVIQNYNGGPTQHWPRRVQESLENYIEAGGGLVIYHAANNAFPNWPAYNEMIGLGWRSKEFGPTLIVGDGKEVIKVPAGEGIGPGHGPDHEFVVEVLDSSHPICRDLPPKWLHPSDQLSHGQHGPARNMTVLTYAHSRDSGQNEVLEWVIPYGKGRIFTTMLGHIWEGQSNIAVRCVAFQTTFIRGVEWAATGRVTYSVPESFPTPDKILLAEIPVPEAVEYLDLLDNHSYFYWRGRNDASHDWARVGSVVLNPEDPKQFVSKPGSGVFYNGPSGFTADLYLEWPHGDCELHLEFVVPEGSNSGVYLMGRYEIQILDSWEATELTFGSCGGIYARYIDGKTVGGKPPRVNASRPPGEWQSYDIIFHAPRFDADGNKVANAVFVKVVWNGQVIHENVEVDGPTRGALFETESARGPLMIQGDHGPVAYRNMILRPLGGI